MADLAVLRHPFVSTQIGFLQFECPSPNNLQGRGTLFI